MTSLLDGVVEYPSCFCKGNGPVCEEHGTTEPSVLSVLQLIDKQIQEINADEIEMEENLGFVADSLNDVLLSRKDTFKEKLVLAYQDKDDELKEADQKIDTMLENEQRYQTMKSEKEQLEIENASLRQTIIAMQQKNMA